MGMPRARPDESDATPIAAIGPPDAGRSELGACSVLFPPGTHPDEDVRQPDFFVDLNLDQIVRDVTAGREEYHLDPFFRLPLPSTDGVRWRHDVIRDLQRPGVVESVRAFAHRMQATRRHLAQAEKLRHELQKQRWFVHAVRLYCDAVTGLARDLSGAPLSSAGFSAFREHLAGHVASEPFTVLAGQLDRVESSLAAVRYEVRIDGLTVEVRRYGGAADYSEEVEDTFRRFEQSDGKTYGFAFVDYADMNQVEGKILDGVATLFPDAFAQLAAFCTAHLDHQDTTVVRFDREVQVYLGLLELVGRLEAAGLSFCFPTVVEGDKTVRSDDGFDLALARKLVDEGKRVVCNDFHLDGRERVIVVSGPNQGGKTTFARTFGQLHYLASLGFLVPGTRARLLLFDRLFTHFEREEHVQSLRGKLQDDLVRIHDILEHATSDSIVVLNEMLTSTTLHDALLLSKRIAAKLLALDVLCVWVTFIDELASLDERTVSMTSTVVPENPAERTFRIVRAPANGLAYALSIAEKYGLTSDTIRRRIRP